MVPIALIVLIGGVRLSYRGHTATDKTYNAVVPPTDQGLYSNQVFFGIIRVYEIKWAHDHLANPFVEDTKNRVGNEP